MNEETLTIIKPDAMQKNLAGDILKRFEDSGLRIKEFNITKLTKDFVKQFYSHLEGKHHPKIVESTHDFMTSDKVMIVVLEGEDAVKKARSLCGPTNPQKAPKGTIRGDFSDDDMEERTRKLEAVHNVIHSSGSLEESAREIALVKEFFW